MIPEIPSVGMWVAGGSPSFGEYGGSREFSARYRATDAVGEPGGYVYAYILYLFRDHIERKSFWSQYRK